MEKEVQKEVKKKLKKDFELDLISLIKAGKRPSQIAKDLKITLPNLSYYLSSLKREGIIRKIGYGVWEVKEVKTNSKDTTTHEHILKEIRGHAYIWKVKVPKEIKGYNLESKLRSRGLKYKLVGIKKTPSITILNKKVWLGNNNLVIYDSNSYLGQSAIESRKYAVFRLLSILEALQKELDVSFKTTNGYIFKPSREHYSLIKNELAHQYNMKKERLVVRYHSETWFIIDNSFNLDEAETIHPETALIDNLGVQKFFNELKELNFEATPKETWKAINQVTNNQLIFAKNMESHINAINTLSNEVKRLGKIMRKNIQENINLKKQLTGQKSLLEF